MLPSSVTRKFGVIKLHPVSCAIFRQSASNAIVAERETRTSLKVDKKPPKPPFMKNVFIGKFDKEMLVYPELDKPRLTELKKRIQPFEDYFKNNVEPTVLSSLKIIPNEIKESLKHLGLFGQIVPSSFGGSDQTATETAMINEVLAKDLNIALMLYSHNFMATQSILQYGSSELKEKYLPQLASGKMIAGFCLSESNSGSDLASLTTKAVCSEDNPDIYHVNGKKMWVINGNIANIFLVGVKYNYTAHTGKVLPLLSLLVIERDSPGVTVTQTMGHIGLNSSHICEVEFKDTPVHKNNFIGNDMQGFDICFNILNNGRYNIGAITVSMLKNLLKIACEYISDRRQYDKPLVENEYIQEKVVEIARCIYTLESMTYLTTSILDNYDNPDCSLELAIIKVFSFTEGRHALDRIMELMGGRAFLKSEIIQKYFRDFRTMEVFDGTTDIANLYISLSGLQYAGKVMSELIRKLRFPFQYPSFMLKRAYGIRGHINDNPKLTLELYEQIHPTLRNSADELEYCVLRLQYAVTVFFHHFGADIVNQQINLMRLADAAVKIYAMTAVLGRSSRAYCIGLPNAEKEVKLAIKVCYEYKRIVQRQLNDLIEGIPTVGDAITLNIGPDIFKNRGYFIENPLERSY